MVDDNLPPDRSDHRPGMSIMRQSDRRWPVARPSLRHFAAADWSGTTGQRYAWFTLDAALARAAVLYYLAHWLLKARRVESVIA